MTDSGTIRVLGIETSCDETAASVVSAPRNAPASSPSILSNVVRSQLADHAPFGGVVPEIAARAHLQTIDNVVARAMADARLAFADLDAIAVTAGPGLAGGLIVGSMTAQALCAVTGKPMLAVNHLEGHALTARLTDGAQFPYLVFLVSGGHTQILLVRGVGRYERWATTIDDALGEAFDKTAKLLGLPYPGGPQVEEHARRGEPMRFDFPRPRSGDNPLDMSFSGLKTAVRVQAEKLAPLTQQDIADICASFQQAVADVISDRSEKAMKRFFRELETPGVLVVAGGVAANRSLRQRLEEQTAKQGFRLIAPPLELCTDNAAMIAWAGLERLAAGLADAGNGVAIRPRWPLDPGAGAQVGGGKRGVKV